MSAHEQTDLFGGTTPLEELELTGHNRALAQAEREHGQALTADEAGALVHARRGKHPLDARCRWCGEDGTEALVALNARRARIQERAHQAATGTPWTCEECGHENPPASTFCRGCAATQDDEPEPRVAGYNHRNRVS